VVVSQFLHCFNCIFCVGSLVEMEVPERLVQSSSFKKFLKTVGIDSNSTDRSASLPSKGARSASTFYSYSSEDLAECNVPFKCGWLLRQSRGVLRSWQVGHDKNIFHVNEMICHCCTAVHMFLY